MSSQHKRNMTSEIIDQGEQFHTDTNSPPSKRPLLIDPKHSPSIRNQILIPSHLDYTTVPPTSYNSNHCTNMKQLKLNSTNVMITGRVHYKYEIANNVGKIIFYDQEGNCCNLLCFQDNIKRHYDKLQEADIITITKPLVRTANERYTLCNSTLDLCLTQFTTWEKLLDTEEMTFPIAFCPLTISEIQSTGPTEHELFDCIAGISTIPDTRTVVLQSSVQQNIATVTISDKQGNIQLTAWGDKMISVLLSCITLPQTVFAFSRLKRAFYQGKSILYLFEGAEIYKDIDHELMQSTKEYFCTTSKQELHSKEEHENNEKSLQALNKETN